MLLDYAGWAAENSIAIQHFESTNIPLDHLQRIVKEKDISFRVGDILLIRSGYTTAYERLSANEQTAIPQHPSTDFVGVEPSKKMLQWIWENRFAAVARDMVAFERTPLNGPHSPMDGTLHQWLLAGWGMPIGELFDLGRLAQQCEKLGRWSFFFTSVPLKVSSHEITVSQVTSLQCSHDYRSQEVLPVHRTQWLFSEGVFSRLALGPNRYKTNLRYISIQCGLLNV